VSTMIGLVGGQGAGKTTAADYLCEYYGARLYALAAPIKSFLASGFELSHDQLHDGHVKEAVDPRYGISARHMMERTGDGLAAAFGLSFLAERLLATLRQDRPGLAVISDVRRIHEADLLRQHGVCLWRLHHAPGVRRGGSRHPTETEWQRIDVDLDITPGAGGVEQLYAGLDQACRMFAIERLASAGHTVTLCPRDSQSVLHEQYSKQQPRHGPVADDVNAASDCAAIRCTF
jgi:hypothetical protein